MKEIRNVLELYGVGDTDTRVYHDSRLPRRATDSMHGDLQRLIADLLNVAAERLEEAALQTRLSADGQIYLLANEEANGQGLSIDGARTLTLWIAGHATSAAISVDGNARPGDVVGFRFLTEEPTPVAEGARMMLIDDDHIVGIGVITSR